LTGETRGEKISRKVREVLGRDTLLDKAHARVDEAASYYHSLSSPTDIKNSVLESVSNLGDKIAAAASPVHGEKSKLTKAKEVLFGDAKDNKIEAANKMLQEAIKKLEEAKNL